MAGCLKPLVISLVALCCHSMAGAQTRAIEGLVTDAKGRPAVNIPVVLVEASGKLTTQASTRTDAHGRYWLEGHEMRELGNLELYAFGPNGSVGCDFIYDRSLGWDIKLPEVTAVKVRFIDPSGKPFADQAVKISSGTGVRALRFDAQQKRVIEYYEMTTDSAGEISLTWNTGGTLRIEVEDPRYQAVTLNRGNPTLDDEVEFRNSDPPIPKEITLEPCASITGRVTDSATGEPVPSAEVVFLWAGIGVPVCSATTDKDGRYSLTETRESEYRLIGIFAPKDVGPDGTPLTYTLYDVVSGERLFELLGGLRVKEDYSVKPIGVYKMGDGPWNHNPKKP